MARCLSSAHGAVSICVGASELALLTATPRPDQPTPTGWLLDYATGTLQVDPSKRSGGAALALRGGTINSQARDLLPKFGIPLLSGYSYSLPLNGNHVMLRGTPELDCLHYCSFGYAEIMIYELWRQLKGGIAGVKPLSDVAVGEKPVRACKTAPGTY